MVSVKISETYDLSTEVNKMGIIGIHTPSPTHIQQVWGNLFKAHKFFRYDKCDVTIACASMLPADPLQIGTEAGDIAPQDMFNPILYTAVSNDRFNVIQNRIYGAADVPAAGGTLMGSLVRDNVDTGAFDLYYSLLADPDGWRKAMPQAGLEMHGLYPIVYQMVNTYGNVLNPLKMNDQFELTGQTESDKVYDPVTGSITNDDYKSAYTFRGPSMRMPKIPTQTVTPTYYEALSGELPYVESPQLSPTYVACIITPPAKLHKLYYRMKVTWTIEFTGLCSDLESATSIATLIDIGKKLYGTDYAEQSSKMDTKSSSVDVKDADLNLIMTSTR